MARLWPAATPERDLQIVFGPAVDRKCSRRCARTWFIQQSSHTLGHEARPAFPHRRRRYSESLRYLHIVQALCAGQYHSSSPPFLLVGILIVASDGKLMGGQPSSVLGKVVVGFAAAVMFVAAAAMFWV